jgi:hypothetical protein
MKPSQEQLVELRALIARVREGQPTPEQQARLQQMLTDSDAARTMYARYTAMQAILELAVGGIDAERPTANPRELSGGWLPATIEDDRTSSSSISPVVNLFDAPGHATVGYFSSGWPIAYLIATVVFAVGLLVGTLVHVSPNKEFADHTHTGRTPNPQSPAPNSSPTVARITGSVDCVWDGAANHQSEIINEKSPLHLGDTLALRSGLLEITYDTGAKIILQGPATYQIQSPADGYLSVGKLTAKLEKRSEVSDQRTESANHQSEITNQKFVVRTPTATVTDLGTEFGVEVDAAGATQSHVFRGSVIVQGVSPDGKVDGAGQVLHENESARVDIPANHGGAPRVSRLQPSAKIASFVRKMPRQSIKTLDLADLVAGGDGFSGRRGRGIDPTNGFGTDVIPQQHLVSSDRKYHRVQGVPLVDGVFIPCGNGDPVQLDSAGHSFAEFPTSENKTDGLVFATSQGDSGSKLGGIDYASSSHGMIAMHANKGVTFDLDAVRRANPGWKPLRFRGVAGIASRTGQAENLIPNGSFTSGIDGWIGGGATGSLTADTSSPDGHNMLLTNVYEGYCNISSVRIKQGQQYDLSFMAASPNKTATDGPSGSLVVRLWWAQGDKCGVLAAPFNIPAADLNRGWTPYNVTWTIPAGHDGDSLQLTFDAAGTGANERYAIDDVVLSLGKCQGYADFSVFVDGKPRFTRWQVNRLGGPMPAVVPIKDSDRFLTLVTTDGGDGIENDDTIFGDPQLDMVSAGPATVPKAASNTTQH